MAKTLSESAAEILNASMKANKEPQNKMDAEVEDLGGATTENPGGTEIGAIKSANAKEAPKPVPGATTGEKKFGEVKSGNVSTPAAVGAEMNPSLGEETEDSTEEVISEEDSDEEVEQMDEEEILEAKKKMTMDMVAKHKGSMSEDVDALFNGESLSEEFRVKATTIFEAAVQSRVEKIVESVIQDNDTVLAEAVESIKADLSEKVDEYMNYVVEEWMEENKVAVETGLRAELAEDFINGLKTLFAEHYVEIPEEKVDVAEELALQVADLQEALDAAQSEKTTLAEQLNGAKKYEAIRKACFGLTETQVAKLTSLAESVEFTTEGDYDNKLATIRENYFPSKINVKSEVKVIQETSEDQPEVAQINGLMAHYVNSITKTAPKA